MRRRSAPGICLLLLCLVAPAAAEARRPAPAALTTGWEVRVEPATPAPAQPAPPPETSPETGPTVPQTPDGRSVETPGEWRSASVPSVFDTRALASL